MTTYKNKVTIKSTKLLYSADIENIVSQCTLFGTKCLSVGSYFLFFHIFIMQVLNMSESQTNKALIEIYK